MPKLKGGKGKGPSTSTASAGSKKKSQHKQGQRRDIRKVKDLKELDSKTTAAMKAEEERRRRRQAKAIPAPPSAIPAAAGPGGSGVAGVLHLARPVVDGGAGPAVIHGAQRQQQQPQVIEVVSSDDEIVATGSVDHHGPAGNVAIATQQQQRLLPAFMMPGGAARTIGNPATASTAALGPGMHPGMINRAALSAAANGGRVAPAGGTAAAKPVLASSTSSSSIIVVSSDDEAGSGGGGGGGGAAAPKKRTRKVANGKAIKLKQVATFTNDSENSADAKGNVLINFLREKGEESDAMLVPELAKVVKPHQIGGIRFMWENIVETDELYKGSDGFGCILAHSMGLGKTIQVVSFVHTLVSRFKDQGVKVLIIVPVNTITNWRNEFEKWIHKKHRCPVFVLGDAAKAAAKTIQKRVKTLQDWDAKKGVLIMGYELFRILTQPTTKGQEREKKRGRPKGQKHVIDLEAEDKFDALNETCYKILVNPGPDVVICDEGHRIKNKDASISKALKAIKTKRRAVLTGYPLQNNLEEYWCMVDFVRPDFLGTLPEFNNRFANPIKNGQCSDSKEEDKEFMRDRSFVLHHMLEGFVQRRDEGILVGTLPRKAEFVIPIRLSPVQEDLYKRYLEHRMSGSDAHASSLFKSYHTLAKVWNHPDLLLAEVQSGYAKAKKEHAQYVASATAAGAAMPPPPELDSSIKWAAPAFSGYQPGTAESSGKVLVALEILEQACLAGDKTLIFSQSLETLSMLEQLLQARVIPGNPYGDCWEPENTYFRLDGSTAASERQRMIDTFNKPGNTAHNVFLLSTKAGGLGINLIAANRVVLLDSAWNPCHDAQAVCRVFRYGQKKQCFVYRLISSGTMEMKIYQRQIHKTAMSNHVVDSEDAERHFSQDELSKLFEYTESPQVQISDPLNGDDPAMQAVCAKAAYWITEQPFQHQSLLVEREKEAMNQKQKRLALKSYKRAAASTSAEAAALDPTSWQMKRSLAQQKPTSLVKLETWTDQKSGHSWRAVRNVKSTGEHDAKYWYNTVTREVQWIHPMITTGQMASSLGGGAFHQLFTGGAGSAKIQQQSYTVSGTGGGGGAAGCGGGGGDAFQHMFTGGGGGGSSGAAYASGGIMPQQLQSFHHQQQPQQQLFGGGNIFSAGGGVSMQPQAAGFGGGSIFSSNLASATHLQGNASAAGTAGSAMTFPSNLAALASGDWDKKGNGKDGKKEGAKGNPIVF